MTEYPSPRLQLLSNGRYHVMVTREGTGFSHWNKLALTRWCADASCGGLGSFCYLRDVSTGVVWSTTPQPVRGPGDDDAEPVFTPGRATFTRRHADGGLDITAQTDIVVAPDDDLELRRLHLHNLGGAPCTLSLTSYLEVVLGNAVADTVHPAFEKLFVESEVLAPCQAVLFTRRARHPGEATPCMFHLLLCGTPVDDTVTYETDRMRFIGRGRGTARPQVLDSDAALAGHAGAVLDPVAAIRCGLVLDAGQAVTVDLVTGVAASRAECLALVQRCRVPGFAAQTLADAGTRAFEILRQAGCTAGQAKQYADLAWSVLHADAARRAAPGVLAANVQGQSGLWRFAISGDLPIVLLRLDAALHLGVLRQLVGAQAYWRAHGLATDLVVLVGAWGTGQAILRASATAAVEAEGAATRVGKPGGIFLLTGEAMPEGDKLLLLSAARVVVVAQDGWPARRSARRMAARATAGVQIGRAHV